MIKRIFHPIGQGAFYSERHAGFNIVYDCGNWKNSRLGGRVVQQAFRKDETIDILFISHFDYDHVCKIGMLKSHTKIKRVIMPLLHENEMILLTNTYRLLNLNSVQLIHDPQSFFGVDTQITRVQPVENEADEVNSEAAPQDIADLGKQIPSGTILKISGMAYDWVFIPYNYDNTARSNHLEVLLQQDGGFDLERLKSDTPFALDVIDTPDQRKRLKKYYEKLDGNINQNSMILYSGPLHHSDKYRVYHRFNESCCDIGLCMHYYHCENDRAACLYTGDVDVTNFKLKDVFSSLWNNVGTIQIPHHGALKGFDARILEDSMPLISVIVAVYNGANTVQRCIDSVKPQTYPNVEFIIMDGGSTDGTVEIIKSNEASIAYWESKSDHGIYHAWNKALEHVHGEWICFLGADDYFWSPCVLEQMAPSLVEAYPHCRVVYGRVALVNKKDEVLYHAGEPWEKIKKKFRQIMALPHQGVMHHISLFEAHGGFDERFQIAGDYELLLRELKDRDAFFVPEVVVVGMRQGGVSSDPSHGLLLLEETRKAHLQAGLKSGWRWYFAYLRVRLRLLLWCVLGESFTRKLLDAARVCMGKPRHWTRT